MNAASAMATPYGIWHRSRAAERSKAYSAVDLAAAAFDTTGSSKRTIPPSTCHDEKITERVIAPNQSAVTAASLASPPPIQPIAKRMKAKSSTAIATAILHPIS